MPAPFNIVGIDHVVLRAANPAALERFYLDVLGLSLEKRQRELAQLRARLRGMIQCSLARGGKP
jgi:catechol 2,3-dioxygenase-like lactoylglutathione lyase family enzyme